MKFILIFIQFSFIVFSACAQDNEKTKEAFKEKLLAIRKEKTDAKLNEDPNLSMIANKIRIDKLTKVGKDSIRHLLAYYFIYDYNFDIIDLNISGIEEINKTTLKEESIALKEILQNNKFNKMGIDIENSKRKSKVIIVASQNYLSFDKVSYLAPVVPIKPHTPTERKIKIRGKMIIDGAYFYTKVKDNTIISNDKLLNESKKPLILKEDHFMIEEKWDYEDIVFLDSEGKIVSYIPVQ